jgi:3-dehydroquinate synthase
MAVGELIVLGAEEIEYTVRIGPGVLDEAMPVFIDERGFKRAAVITNETLAPLYGDSLAEGLTGGFLITIPDGEQYKTLATVQTIYDALLANGADRGTLVIALGGGVVGDVAGYAAATFMRGVPLIQAPTSLLAMVDASIGGKVGVDLPQGKNLVGAFKDPLAVFADTFTLETLPEDEFRCGMAEVVKSALIDDPSLLDHLNTRGPQPIEEIIERAAAVKVAIVEEDRMEANIRAYLNLGHTFAHALETVSTYAWKHGEAVSLGLVAAARLSELLKLCERGLAETVENSLIQAGLPVRYEGYTPEQLWDAMRVDKKWREGASRFVLLKAPGKPTIEDKVPQDAVIKVLKSLQQ